MAQSATESAQQYFLGIAGEQTGPFSGNDILAKIRGGEVPQDALVWHEGLPEWKPLNSLPNFAEAFKPASKLPQAPPPPQAKAAPAASSVAAALNGPKAETKSEATTPATVAATVAAKAPAAAATVQAQRVGSDVENDAEDRDLAKASTFAQGEAEPIFSPEEAVFSKPSFWQNPTNVAKVVGGAVAGVITLGIVISLMVKPDVPVIKEAPKVDDKASIRVGDLRKALSELITNPAASLGTLNKIAREKPDDDIGKQAVAAYVEYYKTRVPTEAGRMLMVAKRANEALKYFLMDPPSYTEAHQALVMAVDQEQDPARRKQLLLQDIQLLLGPISNHDLAVERVRLLEKLYPGEPHPYGYYLKTTDEKLRDIFDRISYYFVGTLTAFVDTELPGINLAKKPLVVLTKEPEGYRLVGTYEGEITLNRDRLSKMKFVFWATNGQWVLVDTNLTAERQKFTAQERERQKANLLSGEDMLAYFEQTFRSQFPKRAVHEAVLARKK